MARVIGAIVRRRRQRALKRKIYEKLRTGACTLHRLP